MRSLFANLRQRMLRLAHAIREGIVVGGGGWAGRDVSRNADETRGRNDPGNYLPTLGPSATSDSARLTRRRVEA